MVKTEGNKEEGEGEHEVKQQMRESGTEVLGARQNEGKTQLTDIWIVGS